jgi:hypothetical protein
MRKTTIALAAALAAHASAASADWLLVSQDDFSKIYMDPQSRETLPEGRVSVRALTDYDPRAEEAARFGLAEKGLSEIETVVMDCRNEKFRSGGGSWFTEHMAGGAVKSAYAAKEAWSKTPAFYSTLFSKLCRP